MNVIVPCLIVAITAIGIVSLIVDTFMECRKHRIEKLNNELNIPPTYSFFISASPYEDD